MMSHNLTTFTLKNRILKNILFHKMTIFKIKDGKRQIAKYKAIISTIILRNTIRMKIILNRMVSKNMKIKIHKVY